MSLLFCMWADQEEAKEEVNDSKQDSSNEETNDAKVESGKEIESHSGEKSEDTTKVATNFPEEHTEQNDKQSKDITESDDSPPKENELEEVPSEKKESDEPPLKKNKPEEPPRKKFVGPRSVMLKRMEKKAAAARKEALKPTGSIILNTLREPLQQDTTSEEEELVEEQDRPRFFSFPNDSTIKQEAEEDEDDNREEVSTPSDEAYNPDGDRSTPDSLHSKSDNESRAKEEAKQKTKSTRKSSRRSKTPTKFKNDAEHEIKKKKAKSRRSSLELLQEDITEKINTKNSAQSSNKWKRENLRRKAQPHTFSQGFDLDPESPFLYTHDRRSGRGVNVERDVDDSEDFYPNKKIKVELEEPRSPPRLQENETFGFGISLGSVFSLAESPVKTRHRANAEPVIVKQEPLDGWGDDVHYATVQEDEPMGDPLSLKPKSLIKVRRPFIWPKLDPLFLTQIEYRLPKEFDPFIKALTKPTAEILPIPKRKTESNNQKPSIVFLKSTSALTVTRTGNKDRVKPVSTPAPEPQPTERLRRSGRKSKGRYNLEGLFSEYPTDLAFALDESKRATSSPPSQPTRTSPGYSLPASLSKMGSGITITPIKSSLNSNTPEILQGSVTPQASIVAPPKVSSLKLTNVPWLPPGWKTQMSSVPGGKGKTTTLIHFTSPEGLTFKTKQQVMKHISSAKKKEQKKAPAAVPPSSKIAPSEKAKRSLNILKKNNESMQALNGDSPGSTDTDCIIEIPNPNPRAAKPPADKYKILCKPGNYTCPLCCTEFKMNQTYGRHVVNKECKVFDKTGGIITLTKAPWMLEAEEKEEDIHVVQENVTKAALNYVTVINSTTEEDSYVYSSAVPALKSLARGALMDGGIKKYPIYVKEGLEYYHSIVWKDNHEELFFQKLCTMSKTHLAANVKSYEKLCKEPLKVALYLEKKIRASRTCHGKRAKRTKDWVLKYESFLKLPLHDIFLSLMDSKHKVIEYFLKGNVKVLCLNCPKVGCSGCVVQMQPKGKMKVSKGRLRVPIRVKSIGYTGKPSPPAVPSAGPVAAAAVPKPSGRCGSCKGCKRPACAQCVNCIRDNNNPEICLFRRCINRSTPKANSNTSTQEAQGGFQKITFTDKFDLIANLSPKKPDKSVSNHSSGTTSRQVGSRTLPSAKPAAPSARPQTFRSKQTLPKPSRTVTSSMLRAGRPESGMARVPSQGGMYPCTVCRKGFKTRIEMIAHRSETHKKKVKPAAAQAKAVVETVIDVDALEDEPEPPKKSPAAPAQEPATFSLLEQEQDEDDAFQRELMNAINESLGNIDLPAPINPVLFE